MTAALFIASGMCFVFAVVMTVTTLLSYRRDDRRRDEAQADVLNGRHPRPQRSPACRARVRRCGRRIQRVHRR
jgi:hypothetical protein